MRVLIIKTSSMGDVIHTLPALTDAGIACPGIRFDWVVEEKFAEIPQWHPLVDDVIPVALRRWRKNIFASATRAQWHVFREKLKAKSYDLIIDAQGLMKSAMLTRFVSGTHAGFDWSSAREPLASLFYDKKFSVAKGVHAITRVRDLFSQAMGYALPMTVPNYGIDRRQLLSEDISQPYLVFLHGTTWQTKHWPEEYWLRLVEIATANGFVVKLPWGNAEEEARALRLAKVSERVCVLPRLDLIGMAKVLAGARSVVSVDTGLGHLAAALDVPGVSLYGPTNPVLTGALGGSQVHLGSSFGCAPCLGRECSFKGESKVFPGCFGEITPELVFSTLKNLKA